MPEDHAQILAVLGSKGGRCRPGGLAPPYPSRARSVPARDRDYSVSL